MSRSACSRIYDESRLPECDAFAAGYATGDDGTGSGLAIVDRIAAEHGQSIDAAEADGGGARFEFRG